MNISVIISISFPLLSPFMGIFWNGMEKTEEPPAPEFASVFDERTFRHAYGYQYSPADTLLCLDQLL